MSRHRRDALKCVGCGRLFSNQGAFDVHRVHDKSWSGESPGRCASVLELEQTPDLRKVGGVWFKRGKDL